VSQPARPAQQAPGADPIAGRGLDTHYEQLRNAALHHRAQAFPLGLGVLAGNGVIAWHRVVCHLTPTTSHAPNPGGDTAWAAAGQLALPVEVTGELVNILATIALIPMALVPT
jgi:hypothetical protein